MYLFGPDSYVLVMCKIKVDAKNWQRLQRHINGLETVLVFGLCATGLIVKDIEAAQQERQLLRCFRFHLSFEELLEQRQGFSTMR